MISAHDSGSGAALVLPSGFRQDSFQAAIPDPRRNNPACVQRIKVCTVATQSIFPFSISRNKVELASISSGLELSGVAYSQCLSTSSSNTPITALLIHTIQKTRLKPLPHFTSSFLPFFLLALLLSFFSPLSFNQKKKSYRI